MGLVIMVILLMTCGVFLLIPFWASNTILSPTISHRPSLVPTEGGGGLVVGGGDGEIWLMKKRGR